MDKKQPDQKENLRLIIGESSANKPSNNDWLKQGQNKPTISSPNSKQNSQTLWKGNLEKFNTIPTAKNTNIPPPLANEQKKDCPFCHAADDSFYLFPVRYATTKKNDAKFPQLPTQLNNYVNDKNLSHSQYTLKYLNIGYLYALVEYENGVRIWQGYRVNDEGFLAKLKNIYDPDCAPTPYGCNNEKHFANSSMICLTPFNKSRAKNVYILFTKGFLTKNRLDLYQQQREKYVTEKKWQKIDINQWRSAQKSSHCFNQQIFDKHVPTPNFAKYDTNKNAKRKKSILEKFATFPKAVCGVAVYDALGITIELNEHRNDQFIELSTFMNTYKNGISNHHRFNTIPLIESIEQGLKTKAIQSAKNWAEHVKNIDLKTAKAQSDHPFIPHNYLKKKTEWSETPNNPSSMQQRVITSEDYAKYYNRSQSASEKRAYEKRVEKIEQEAKDREQHHIERNTNIAANEWQEKYAKLLDLPKMVEVKNKVASHTKNGMENASIVAKDHLLWLQSKQLVNELNAFDQNHKESGFVFYEYTMQAMEGTGVTESGKKVIDQWILSNIVTPENIFMRSVLFNNATTIQHYNQGTQDFFSTVTNYTDWNTSQNTYKQFMVTIAALDAAWDEWVSNNANKHYMMPNYDKTFEGRIGRWSAEFIRVATQKAKAVGADRLIATQVCTFIYARTGIFDKGITLKSLMFFIVPKLDPNYKPPDVSQKIAPILNDSKSKGATRVASFIMLLEAVNLIFQLNRPIDAQQKLQIFGGACGLITASLELVGVFTSANKNATHNMIKLAANSFAIIGSAFFAIYDFRGLFENLSKDKFLALIYASRGAVYFGLSLGYTIISIDFLQKIGDLTKRPTLLRLSGILVRTNVYRFFAFLGSVVWLARLNLIILGLTAIEIMYKAFIADNKLQNWCKKSAFGTDKEKFKNEGKELEAFNQAFAEVIGI